MQNAIDPTINTYNLYDDVYDNETVDFWRNFPRSTIRLFVKHLPGNKILDIGSGPGRDALLLKDEGLEVVCLDGAEKMVKRTTNLGFESILADFRKLNFPQGTFDGIWAYTSLLHIKKDEMISILATLSKILKKGGVFLIGMIEGEYDGNLERESMPNSYRYFKHYTEKELKKLITKRDFKFVSQERYKPHNNTYLAQLYVRI